jgi:hypothetical protein
MRNDIYRYDMTELSRFAAANHKSNDLMIIVGDQRPAFSRSHIELKLEAGISEVSAECGPVYFVKMSEI